MDLQHAHFRAAQADEATMVDGLLLLSQAIGWVRWHRRALTFRHTLPRGPSASTPRPAATTGARGKAPRDADGQRTGPLDRFPPLQRGGLPVLLGKQWRTS